MLADGAVVNRMAGLRKDNAGYDLASLLIGSEGTLGVVTQVPVVAGARSPTARWPWSRWTRSGEAVEAARALLPRLPSLELLELIDEPSIRISLEHLSGAPPAPITRAWVLVGCASSGDAQEELAERTDGVRARRRRGRGRRRRPPSAAAVDPRVADRGDRRGGVPHKLDVGVPLAAVESFLDELPAVVAAAAPGARTFVYGHLGDGNLHVNLLGPAPDDESADAAVLQLAARIGGTITAEHGVGRHKPHICRWCARTPRSRRCGRSSARSTPTGILNPGVILA